MSTVLFLGAGVSKSFGYPLTGEILPLIIEGINNHQLFSDYDNDQNHGKIYRKLLKNLLVSLSPGLDWYFVKKRTSKVEGLPLVTDLLSQLDHAIVNSNDIKDWNFELDDGILKESDLINSRWDLKSLKILFEWAISAVIKTQDNENSKLNKFIKYIEKSNKNSSSQSNINKYISIITTNYDYSIEYNLLEWGEAKDAYKLFDYGFAWRQVAGIKGSILHRPTHPNYRILKLHGSVDWLKCERCGYIYINPCMDIYTRYFEGVKDSGNSCHCGYWPLKPVLVTPSYVRNVFDTNIHEIWKSALEYLRVADNWIIAGYSLPNEDFNIKSMILRAWHGRINKPNVTVIQLGNNAKIRFDHLFGINQYTYFDKGIDKFKFEAFK